MHTHKKIKNKKKQKGQGRGWSIGNLDFRIFPCTMGTMNLSTCHHKDRCYEDNHMIILRMKNEVH